MAKCRFCDNYSGDLVKYGIRHHAHPKCYLEKGKRLEDLHDWQIVKFPYLLCRKLGVHEVIHAAQARIDAKKVAA